MTVKRLEKKTLEARGASERVALIEEELRFAVALTAQRESAGLSQRELAKRMRVSQPRVAAIERCQNVTIDVLEQYVAATGGALEVSVLKDGRRSALIRARASTHAASNKGKGKRTRNTAPSSARSAG